MLQTVIDMDFIVSRASVHYGYPSEAIINFLVHKQLKNRGFNPWKPFTQMYDPETRELTCTQEEKHVRSRKDWLAGVKKAQAERKPASDAKPDVSLPMRHIDQNPEVHAKMGPEPAKPGGDVVWIPFDTEGSRRDSGIDQLNAAKEAFGEPRYIRDDRKPWFWMPGCFNVWSHMAVVVTDYGDIWVPQTDEAKTWLTANWPRPKE